MKDWFDTLDAQNKKQAKYDKNNTKKYSIKLNLHTDKDIIEWLDIQKSKQGAIKNLIRAEIERESKEKGF